MSQQAILAGIGVDRPGIVDEVSRFLSERGGAIEDSQLANLRGAASFMMLVSGTDAVLNRIRSDLPELREGAGMSVDLLPATPLAETAPMRGFPYRLRSRGKDPSGVVHRLSHLLRVLSVNIENLKIDTARPEAPEPAFELNLLVSVPRETPVDMLREYLAQLGREIGISCELSPA